MACNRLLDVRLSSFSTGVADAINGRIPFLFGVSAVDVSGVPFTDFNFKVTVSGLRLTLGNVNNPPETAIYNFTSVGSNQVQVIANFAWFNPNFNSSYSYEVDVLVEISDGNDCIWKGKITREFTLATAPNIVDSNRIVRSTFSVIRGCTDPVALNYNENAIYNDGSCIYQSGCTNPLASNYNQFAFYDDGSCDCEDALLSLDFLPFDQGYTFEPNCTLVFEGEYAFVLDCDSIFYEMSRTGSESVLEMLQNLGLSMSFYHALSGTPLEYTGGTIDMTDIKLQIFQEIPFWDFQVQDEYDFGLEGQNCQALIDILSLELGLDCNRLQLSQFKPKYKRFAIPVDGDFSNQFIKAAIRLRNFDFKTCLYLDNIKVTKLCEQTVETCAFSDRKFGFQLQRTVDNVKSWYYRDLNRFYSAQSERLILNTKFLSAYISPSNLIEKDVVDWHIEYNRRYFDTTRPTPINPRDRQTMRAYSNLRFPYDWYLTNTDDCKLNKGLTYSAAYSLLDLVPNYFYDLAESFIPSALVREGGDILIRNTTFDLDKYKYRRFGFDDTSGSTVCVTGVTYQCNPIQESCVTSDPITIEDIFANSNLDCTITGITGQVCLGAIFDDNTFTGRIIEYQTISGINIVYLNDGFQGLDCEVIEFSGCTNQNALNYNPMATIDDGSCQFCFDGEVYGCTYPQSLNYNPLATIDDGSCIFTTTAETTDCSTLSGFEVEWTFENIANSTLVLTLSLTSPTLTGDVYGSYIVQFLENDDVATFFPPGNRYYLGAPSSASFTMNTAKQIGFVGFTPSVITTNDSAWSISFPFGLNTIGSGLSILNLNLTVIYENSCAIVKSYTINVPPLDSTNTITDTF